MKKSTKGAVAAAAAAVLLLGGAGTLAFWTDDAEVPGGTLTAGNLTLEDADCADATWKHDEDDTDVTLLVPGDSIYKECNVTLNGTGDHLKATVEVDEDTVADLTLGNETLEVGATVVAPAGIDATAVAVSGPTTVTVRITVDWDYGTEDNDSKLASDTLDAIGLIATQVHD